jgi:putative ABC transport system substrate-binding protein
MIGRRKLIAVVGGTLLAGTAPWSRPARTQPALPTVGFLASYSLDRSGSRLAASFREGLKETGYEDGRNIKIEYSSAEGNYGRLPALAADLVGRRVNVIAAVGGSPAALAAKDATTSIPVIFQVGVDPVQLRLVASLNRPGGNVTGIANLSIELGPKRLQMLREFLPTSEHIAVLINPLSPVAETVSQDIGAAARVLGLKLQLLHASAEGEFDRAFASVAQSGARGLVIIGDPFFNSRSERLAGLALHHGVPAAYQFREFTGAGGLLSYGSSLADAHRQAGAYTGRVLKGERPADLPVQQATKVELIINLATAKALGLEVPPTLLARADEVIE